MEHHYLNIFLELPDKCFLAHYKVSEILHQRGTVHAYFYIHLYCSKCGKINLNLQVSKYTQMYFGSKKIHTKTDTRSV